MCSSFFNVGARCGCVVNATPRPLYPGERIPVPIIQQAEWAPWPVWTSAENLAPPGIRPPDSPSRSESLYRPRYPGRWTAWPTILNQHELQLCLKLWQFIITVHTELNQCTRGAEKVLVSQFVKKFPPYMAIRNVLLCLRNSATAPYPRKFQCSLPIHVLCFKIHFNIVFTKTPVSTEIF